MSGVVVDWQPLWPLALYKRIQRDLSDSRQLDLTGTVQHQQQAATDHVAQSAVCLLPLPCLAQLRREFTPAHLRMLSDQIANEYDVFAGNGSAAIAPPDRHLLLSVAERKPERKAWRKIFALTRRQTGAAAASGSAAASSICT